MHRRILRVFLLPQPIFSFPVTMCAIPSSVKSVRFGVLHRVRRLPENPAQDHVTSLQFRIQGPVDRLESVRETGDPRLGRWLLSEKLTLSSILARIIASRDGKGWFFRKLHWHAADPRSNHLHRFGRTRPRGSGTEFFRIPKPQYRIGSIYTFRIETLPDAP